MRTIQMVKNTVTNTWVQAGVALSFSGSAMADNTAAITDAISSGQALVSLTTSGVISLAALGFGVGMVVMWLAKR